MSSPLDNLSIAAPCTANWNDMSGDEKARFCSLCKKHVYNISAMSRAEAEALLKEKEGGRVCLRLFKRADGTVIVDNCPVGLRAIRKRVLWIAEGVAAAVALFGGVIVANAARASGGRTTALKEWFFPPKPLPVQTPRTVSKPSPPPIYKMGDVAIQRIQSSPPSVAPPVTATPPQTKQCIMGEMEQ